MEGTEATLAIVRRAQQRYVGSSAAVAQAVLVGVGRTVATWLARGDERALRLPGLGVLAARKVSTDSAGSQAQCSPTFVLAEDFAKTYRAKGPTVGAIDPFNRAGAEPLNFTAVCAGSGRAIQRAHAQVLWECAVEYLGSSRPAAPVGQQQRVGSAVQAALDLFPVGELRIISRSHEGQQQRRVHFVFSPVFCARAGLLPARGSAMQAQLETNYDQRHASTPDNVAAWLPVERETPVHSTAVTNRRTSARSSAARASPNRGRTPMSTMTTSELAACSTLSRALDLFGAITAPSAAAAAVTSASQSQHDSAVDRYTPDMVVPAAQVAMRLAKVLHYRPEAMPSASEQQRLGTALLAASVAGGTHPPARKAGGRKRVLDRSAFVRAMLTLAPVTTGAMAAAAGRGGRLPCRELLSRALDPTILLDDDDDDDDDDDEQQQQQQQAERKAGGTSTSTALVSAMPDLTSMLPKDRHVLALQPAKDASDYMLRMREYRGLEQRYVLWWTVGKGGEK